MTATFQNVYRLIRRRWDHQYTTAKLKSDPLYAAVYEELSTSNLPLLDLGCGLGLLAFYLRNKGLDFPVHSLDYDPRKVDEARRLATERGLSGLTFAAHDARTGLPEHQGNVTILDILQFFTPGEIVTLLGQAAARVAPGGKLVVRACLRDNSWRYKTNVAGDFIAKATFWMKDAPIHYATAEDFRRILSPFGSLEISPLWGSTPFNNHLIVLEKR